MTKQLPIRIDRSSPVPLYHQLAEQLTAAIESGVLQPGDAFENELSLAERLDLSRPTVRRAIAEMVARGLLVRRRGIGTTVANEVIHRRDELTSLYDDLVRSGRTPRTEILSFEPDTVDEVVASQLGLEPGTPLLSIERLRLVGDQPLAVLHNWLPPQYAAITQDELVTTSLYELLRARGAKMVVAHQAIGARRPSGREARLLGIRRSEPVLTMRRTAYDPTGAVVELGDHCYQADQYSFDITVREQ